MRPIAPLKGRALSDPPASAAWARAPDDRRAAGATSLLKRLKPADRRVLILGQGSRQQVPPCAPHQVGLAVLQAVAQHAPLCLQVQRQPDQLVSLGAGVVTAPVRTLIRDGVRRCVWVMQVAAAAPVQH